MKWQDCNNYIILEAPEEFSFDQCLVYLNRSKNECMHKVEGNALYKLIKVNEQNFILRITSDNAVIRIDILNDIPDTSAKEKLAGFVWYMFDLDADLKLFYNTYAEEAVLSSLINKYKGLRIIKIEDMFEAICWAVIGQQINIKFAYTLKRRLVEHCGEKLSFDGEEYLLFPTPEKVAKLTAEDLQAMQYTKSKAEYIIGIAKLFTDGTISKERLLRENSYDKILQELTAIRGIGRWTADYAILKCFKLNSAFPIADVGIHNALKTILNRQEKPSIDEIQEMVGKWTGWEAYAAFYIWRSLYD